MQEPERFAAGDTLWFERYFAFYLPSDGRGLIYTLTSLDGKLVDSVQSVASDTNPNRHKIYKQGFAGILAAGDYILSGEAINTNTSDRKQIYKAVLTLEPNLSDGRAIASPMSENELDLKAAYATRRVLINRQFTETEDLKSRFVLQKMSEVNGLIKELEEKVIWERRAAKSANGQPDGSTTSPALRVFW